jgi:hypothetical protein
MPADPRFTTRAYRDGDEHAILDLFARSFPHAPRTLEHFRWKYRDNPFGGGRISLTFDEDQRLVGHYSGYPVPFRAFGRDLLAHQIGDTMTDVSVRHIGRGPTSILGRTALHFYEHFCEGQAGFNYGFNVSNIQKFSLRFLRSDRAEPVTYRVRDLAAHPLERVTRMRRWRAGYRLEIVRSAGEEWDELFERVAKDYTFLVRRDARYVRWRYLEHPESPYTVIAIRKWRRLVGWMVYRIRDDRFLWGDALLDRAAPSAIGVALRHVVPLHPVRTVEAWFPPRPEWFDRLLQFHGFETRPEPQDLSVMCVPFTWPEATAGMREALYYSWGDSDLF